TAERENLGLTYQTISAAYLAALPEDTVYVQPGDYILNNLILRDNIDLYFTNSTNISSVSNMFLVEDEITSSIIGYGKFEVNGQSLLNISNTSNITFEGLEVLITSGEFITSISTTNIIINIPILKILSGIGINLSGTDINLIYNFDTITTSTIFLSFGVDSSGIVILRGSEINILPNTLPTFDISSSLLNMSLDVKVIDSQTSNYPFLISTSDIGPSEQISIRSDILNSVSGVISV